jgi:spermidine synthase
MAIEVEDKQQEGAIGSKPARTRGVEGLVISLFFASGAAGLVYQVVWSRELVLVFGNTTQAISTIVTSFMLGLGAGGYVGGRLATLSDRPLRLYGILELLVALFALLLPFEFYMIGEVYRAVYNSLSLDALGLVRFGLALVAVTPVTFLMGMTLPVLTQFMVHDLGRAGSRLAALYSANTMGAVVGTVVSGFVLIEVLGLTATSYVAVALNVVAGIGAIVLAQGATGSPAKAVDEAAGVQEVVATIGPQRRRVVYVATFVSGFVALALEVLWTRMLAEGTGSRIYIFVTILAIFLLGIALGSEVYRRVGSPGRDNLATLGGCFAGVGLLAMVSVVLGSGTLGAMPQEVGYVVLLPATMLMGYAFPLSGKLVTRSVAEAGKSVGLLYMWNTAGSILGSFAAAFLLAGTIGTNSSILALAAISLMLGAWLVWIEGAANAGERVSRRVELAVGVIVLAVLSMGATLARLPITRTKTENDLGKTGIATNHTEDSLATVDALGGPPAVRRLFVGGVGMTALTIDTKLMAYLPKALRPQAQDFLVIAFGMGSTYRSGLLLDMKVDAVELSPSVPGQMPMFYSDADKFLHHPKGNIITADGRNYVRLSNKSYDIIAVDPAPPIQSAGTVVLYTREFLEQGKGRLKPGGVFMLWIPYDEPLSDFKDHLRTFRAVFPHMSVVFGPGGYGVYMLGSDEPMSFDEASIRGFMETDQAKEDFIGTMEGERLKGVDWVQLVRRNSWLADAEVDGFVGPGPLITDDNPRTEYFMLRYLTLDHGEHVGEARLRAESGK